MSSPQDILPIDPNSAEQILSYTQDPNKFRALTPGQQDFLVEAMQNLVDKSARESAVIDQSLQQSRPELAKNALIAGTEETVGGVIRVLPGGKTWGDRMLQTADDYRPNVGSILNNPYGRGMDALGVSVAENAPQMAVQVIPGGVAARAPRLAKALGTLASIGMGAATTGQKLYETENRYDMSEGAKVGNAVVNGIMEFVGEHLGTEKYLGEMIGVDDAKNVIALSVKDWMKKYPHNATSEFASEGFTQLGQDLSDKLFGSDRDTVDKQWFMDKLKGELEAGIVGGVMGVGATAAHHANAELLKRGVGINMRTGAPEAGVAHGQVVNQPPAPVPAQGIPIPQADTSTTPAAITPEPTADQNAEKFVNDQVMILQGNVANGTATDAQKSLLQALANIPDTQGRLRAIRDAQSATDAPATAPAPVVAPVAQVEPTPTPAPATAPEMIAPQPTQAAAVVPPVPSPAGAIPPVGGARARPPRRIGCRAAHPHPTLSLKGEG